MSAVHRAIIRCDIDGPGCWNLDPYSALPAALNTPDARADARAHGWHRVDQRIDVCPACWARRVPYRAGRPRG